MFVGLVLGRSQRCEDWCRNECTSLNGDVRVECGGCSGGGESDLFGAKRTRTVQTPVNKLTEGV